MKRKKWSRYIVLMLALTMTLSFFACNNVSEEETVEHQTNEQTEVESGTVADTSTETATDTMSETGYVTETEAVSETTSACESETLFENISDAESETALESEAEVVSETESRGASETESETVIGENDLDSIIFDNGDDVTSAGHNIEEDAFALIDRTYDKSLAVEKSADEIKAMLMDKTSMAEGAVYIVRETIVLDSNTKYYGNNAVIIAEGGIVIKDAEEILFKELIVEGNITVENSTGIILFRLCMFSDGVAISVSDDCTDISVNCNRIKATDTAIEIASDMSMIYQNYLCADKAIVSTGDDMSAHGNMIVAKSIGISVRGAYPIVKNNTIDVASDGIAVVLDSVSNGLVALNILTGAQMSVDIKDSFNSSVILNSAIRIKGTESTNLYIVDNKLGGAIELEKNNYLICDGNTFKDDSKPHPVINFDNSNYNGDGMHDVDARLEAGADEDLLPHTNKDLFIDMERRSKIRDISLPKSYAFNGYIRNMAKNDSVVIIPPGVYSTSSTLNLQAAHSHTTVYAYGVYQEATQYMRNINMSAVSDVTVKGLTIGYALESAGQIQVLDKTSKNNMEFLVVASAGFNPDLSKLISGSTGGGHIYHEGSYTHWTEIGNWGSYKIVFNEDGSWMNEDGSFKIRLSGEEAPKYYSVIAAGDIISWRINVHNGNNGNTVGVSSSNDILFKDTVTYGYSNALVFVVSGTTSGMKLERHHNLAHSAYEIDKETYDRYMDLEEKYGVDLEARIDEEGRYRGADPRIGSLDATHIGGASQGLSATSTLFENGADDATNQRGYSSCLHEIIDNGDGTLTLRYKDYMAETYYHMYKRQGQGTITPGFQASEFAAGDRIFVYASNGKVFCDTTVLTKTEKVVSGYVIYEEDYKIGENEYHLKWLSSINEVKVKKSDVNMEAIEGYELGISSISMDTKIIVDNMSRNSMEFTFDNCMVRNQHGRMVIKTRNANIKNCTIQNTSMGGIVMSVESTWGESSVPMNVTIERCVFDGTSQTFQSENNTKSAAIAIEGLGSAGVETILSTETIPCKNITITNNVFRNVPNNYYVTVSAAQAVTITDNIFETRDTESSKKIGKAIYINGCMNINISDNTYSEFAGGDVTKVVIANNYIGLTGTDVEGVLEKDKLPEAETE